MLKVKESEAWKAHAAARKSWTEYFRAVAANWKRFVYLIVLMAIMNFMSHGTQDLYPTFLQKQHHLDTRATAIISVISMVGAIAGGIVVGHFSDRFGRRRAMTASALLGLLLVPLWAFAPTMAILAAGAFLMQFMVQGCVGRGSRPHQRAFARTPAWILSGLCLPTGRASGGARLQFRGPADRLLLLWRFDGSGCGAGLHCGRDGHLVGPEAHRIPFGPAEKPDTT